MESEMKKISFFKRIKIAVTKLEDYCIFVDEKISNAVKYFFLIVFIISIVLAGAETYEIVKMFSRGYDYVKNELPDFSFANGELQFNDEVYAYDNKYDVYLIANTSDNISDEELQEYKDEIKTSGIILLKDKVILIVDNDNRMYSYSELSHNYELESLDKAELIEMISDIGMVKITIFVFMMLLLGVYIAELISVFMDWIVIWVFALIATKICRVNLSVKSTFNISIYALTLSLILMVLYSLALQFTNFYTEYFRIIYLLISYVYVVAVILMMKSDTIKQHIEVEKSVEIQSDSHEKQEDSNEKENKEENNEKDNNESSEGKNDSNDEIDGEVDGSEI